MVSTPWDVNSMLPWYLLLSGSINLVSFPVTEACVGGKIELIHCTIIIVDQMSSETKTGFGLACWDY